MIDVRKTCRRLGKKAARLKRVPPRVCFWLFKLLLPQDEIVFLQNAKGHTYRNLLSVYESMHGKSGAVLVPDDRFSLKTLAHVARAQIVVAEQASAVAAAYRLRAGTKFVQIWHAGGMYKKVGYDAMRPWMDKDAEAKRIRRIHGQTTHCVVSDWHLAGICARAFGVDPFCVKPLGLARTDRLFGRNAAFAKMAFFAAHPELEGRKLLLYAPTFRVDAETGERTAGCTVEPERLQDLLGPEWTLLLRLHPSLKEKERETRGWIDCTDMELEPCLCAADVLVTDYSSILFDFACLEKPVYLFIPDEDEYCRTQRGFYFRPEEIAGEECVSRTHRELAEQIREGRRPPIGIRRRFMGACDGLASDRTAQWIETLCRGN